MPLETASDRRNFAQRLRPGGGGRKFMRHGLRAGFVHLRTWTMDAVEFHTHHDPHRQGSWLSDLILGGQDGLVNVLGVILGVAAATSDARLVLVAGLAATFAESVSMAAVAFTSTRAQHALYESERAREHRHISVVPELEREEIRDIYRARGFSGELLERIVETITSDPEVWVAVMMAEELRLQPVARGAALKAALVVGVAALVGSLIPLVPFTIMGVGDAMWASVLLAAATLFSVGVYKARTTVGHWWWSGIEMTTIGIASALVGWLIGYLFKT
jgi:vacuolar iron transporter family protein